LTIETYLSDVFALDKLRIARETQIADLRDKLEYVGKSTCGVVNRSLYKTDRVGDLTAKLLDTIKDYESDLDRLVDVKNQIKSMIDDIEDVRYQLILTERYINLRSWDEIADMTNYNIDYVIYRLHPDAIKKIKEVKEYK